MMSFGAMFLNGPKIERKPMPQLCKRDQQVLDHLRKHGEMSTTHVGNDLNITRAYTNLQKLKDVGLVDSEARPAPQSGRVVWWWAI